jgi:hypothetical protein
MREWMRRIHGFSGFFGFWLPHGFGNISENDMKGKTEECRKNFEQIERMYRIYFNLSDDLAL